MMLTEKGVERLNGRTFDINQVQGTSIQLYKTLRIRFLTEVL